MKSKIFININKKKFNNDYKIYLNEILRIVCSIKKIVHNNMGGSDRKYYYIFGTNKNIVFVDYTKIENELNWFISINKFLHRIKINVPEIYFADDKCVIMEYLGQDTIYKKYKKIGRKNFRVRIYKRIIDLLIIMQFSGKKNINKIPLVRNRIFDNESFIKEWDYFKNMYLIFYKNFSDDIIESFEQYFTDIRKKVCNATKVFMHRDFQSQNIHIFNDNLYFIDYQTAHYGPFTYDIASLLEDPYMNLTEYEKRKLLKYYYDNLIEKKFYKKSYSEFLTIYNLTAVSRLSQATAAYINLGIKKNKKHFLNYLKTSVENLKSKDRIFHIL